jgi:hypothetical protein
MWEFWCDPLRRQVIFDVERLASGLTQPFFNRYASCDLSLLGKSDQEVKLTTPLYLTVSVRKCAV